VRRPFLVVHPRGAQIQWKICPVGVLADSFTDVGGEFCACISRLVAVSPAAPARRRRLPRSVVVHSSDERMKMLFILGGEESKRNYY
jgi:hypothetical protein